MTRLRQVRRRASRHKARDAADPPGRAARGGAGGAWRRAGRPPVSAADPRERPLCGPRRGEPHQSAAAGAGARAHPRPLRRQPRRSTGAITASSSCPNRPAISRRRCGRSAALIELDDADRAPRAARGAAQAQLCSGRRARQSELAGGRAHRGRDPGTARRGDRGGPGPELSLRRADRACAGLCGGGFRKGSDRRSAARTARFPHRQERRREVAGRAAARSRRRQRGRGQRLWPRRARAVAPTGAARRGCGPRARHRDAAIHRPPRRARAQHRLRAARRGDRRRARDAVEPELRPDAVLDRADARRLAGAVDRRAPPADRQGGGRRLSARLDVQAGRRARRARSRHHHAGDPGPLPRPFRPRNRDIPLLEKRRPRHAAAARRDQAILRCLLLRGGAAARHRPPRGDGAPFRLRQAARPRNPRRARRADPEPRVETEDRRRRLDDRRNADRRDRPGRRAGDAAAAGRR